MSHIESLLLPKADFEELLKAEENHFWFKYRNNVIGSNVFELLVNCKNSRFLELGWVLGNVIR